MKRLVGAMVLLGAFGALGAEVTVGTASSMEFAFPRGAKKASVTPAAEAKVRLARSEKESFQLLVTCEDADLADVKVSVSDLSREHAWWAFWEGAAFPAANVDCHVTGYAWTLFPTNSRYTISLRSRCFAQFSSQYCPYS